MSFVHAMEGLSYVYLTQRNMRIHISVATLVGAACIFLGVGRFEVLMVVLAIAGVLVAEVVNTLTESLVDILEPRYHPAAKLVKDVAAAGVLIASVFAAFIGVVAFFPALAEFPERLRSLLRERLALLIVYTCVVVIPSLVGLFFVEFRFPKGRLTGSREARDKEGA
ncbi:MAG TPA: diacylglycerol kinase family protein [Firmicutes bacterium]|nr:diacylglycerol kinase family protein [Candidatus Fermentithermobacillaceae bacterium]